MKQIKSATTNRLYFFDLVRNMATLVVVIYHAVAAYSTVTPYWPVHDGSSIYADFTRQVFDVFMMPIFFFVAGYFALPSLQRKGVWPFLKDKFRRLGISWLYAILIIVPLLFYIPVMKEGGDSAIGFLDYWITYLKSFAKFTIGLKSPEQFNQLHFWFISLLITFFIGFALLYAAKNKWLGGAPRSSTSEPASGKSIIKALLGVGVLTSVSFFIVHLLVPQMTWIKVDLLLEFQPTALVLYIAYFALGIYAYNHQWFAGAEFPDRPGIWGIAAVLLDDLSGHYDDLAWRANIG